MSSVPLRRSSYLKQACLIWYGVTMCAFLIMTFDVARLLAAIVIALGFAWVVLAAWLLVPLFAAIQSVRLLVARRPMAAFGLLPVPAIAIAIFVFGSTIATETHWRYSRPSYERVVDDALHGKCSGEDRKHWRATIDTYDCERPVTVVFLWGGFLSSWYGVIYDEADEIAKPANGRSNGWKHRDIGALLSCSEGYKSLGNHYYLASGSYVEGVDVCG
jgi:hypothetical protein